MVTGRWLVARKGVPAPGMKTVMEADGPQQVLRKFDVIARTAEKWGGVIKTHGDQWVPDTASATPATQK